jgi:hypothetical protein
VALIIGRTTYAVSAARKRYGLRAEAGASP